MATIPLDGRITSLEVLNIALSGGEVMEIVSPGTAADGDNYQVSVAVLAAFILAYSSPTVITLGATIGSPYAILVTDTRILIDKLVQSDTYLVAPLAGLMHAPFLVKDFAGNANTNPITISFTGGQLCDGLSEVTIGSNYGWVTLNPSPGGGSWYQS